MSFVNPINKSYCLEIICESNYQKLLRLVPDLLSFKESATGIAHHQSNLYLKVLALSPYTMTIELSHCFNTPSDSFVEPALHIRLYLDAQIAEVLINKQLVSSKKKITSFEFKYAPPDYIKFNSDNLNNLLVKFTEIEFKGVAGDKLL